MKRINKKVKIVGIFFTYILLFAWGIATSINLNQIEKNYKSLEKSNIKERKKNLICKTQKESIQNSYEIVLKENTEKDSKINDLNNKINDLNSQINDLKKK